MALNIVFIWKIWIFLFLNSEVQIAEKTSDAVAKGGKRGSKMYVFNKKHSFCSQHFSNCPANKYNENL